VTDAPVAETTTVDATHADSPTGDASDAGDAGDASDASDGPEETTDF